MKRAVMGRLSSWRFDSGRLHYSRGIGQGEDDEDDVLRERGPGLAKTCEPRVNRRQVLPIGVRVARLRRCQAAFRKSQTLAKKATCGTMVSGAIPAARSAPAWRADSLAVLDRRAAELRRFPSLWRSARRSHRPKPAFRKVILDGDRRSDGRYLEISASSEESCIRRAVNECGLNSGPVGLADATSEDEAASRWADCAFAYGD